MPNKISTVRESLYRCIDTTFCCEKCAYRGKSRCMRALMIDAFDAIGALILQPRCEKGRVKNDLSG